MKRSIFLFTLPVIILMVLLAALFLTAPVYAQDEVPLEVPPEVVPEEAPFKAPAETPAEIAGVLEEAAEAGVTLVDGSGEPLTLPTEEAAQALAGGDPWYKIGTTTYNFASIQAAIDSLAVNGLPSDGMIYVEAGIYPENVLVLATAPGSIYKGFKGLIGTVVDGEPKVELNGYILVNTVESGFTIKGFDVNANPNAGAIHIINSKGTIKIEDVSAINTDGGPAIYISNQNGAVIFNRVKANNNINGGAWIDNTAGTAGVTITNSSFDYNDVSAVLPDLLGLTIKTKGTVSIDGISVSHNTGVSAAALYVSTPGTLTIKNSVVNNNPDSMGIQNDILAVSSGAITLSNVFSNFNNQGIGLFTKGNITLTGVHADINDYQGAIIDTCAENMTGACTWLGSGVVTIKDSTFYDNGSSLIGLSVVSRGAITLTNVDASENDGGVNTNGATLYAHYSQLVSPVTITNSTFSGNGNNGLVVYTKGAITLTKVKAVDNLNGHGAELNNTYDGVASNVTVNGSALSDNQFDGNELIGLYIYSNGAVTVKYADASQNSSGLVVNNTSGTGSIVISKGTFGWWLGGNDDGGIALYTRGNVTISDVSGTGYSSDGIHLYNDSHTNSIKITNGSFHFNGLNGLDIENGGSVTLTNVQALYNQNLGAEIASWGNILITDSSFDYNGDHPYDVGLYAYTVEGTITLNNVSACYSSGVGASLRNQNASSPKAVSITGGNFNNNAWTGLQVYSKGAITLKNVNATENNEKNIDASQDQRKLREVIDQSEEDQITFQSITGTANNISVTAVAFTPEMWMTGCTATTTHFWDSNFDGIVEHDYGAVAGVCTLHVIDHYAESGGAYEVNLNGTYDATEETYGAELDNTYGTAGITITNNTIPAGPPATYRDFSMNVAGGLMLRTKGAVSITNVVLDDNGGYGVVLRENEEVPPFTYATNVTLKEVYASDNYYSGIWVVNKGNITMTNVASWGHMTAGMGYGAYLDNDAGTGSITIKNALTMPFGFDYNHERGLNIFTNGKVSVTGALMIGNDEDGIRVWDTATGPTSVTLVNCMIHDNVNYGASIRSFGPIVVTGTDFDGNGLAAHLDNTYSGLPTPKPVTLTNVTADDNPVGGLEIDSYGLVSLNNVTVNYSDNAGIIGIDISNYLGPYGVTLTKVSANHNGGAGLNIVTNGAITYKGGELKSNAGDGMTVYNGVEAIAKAITLADLYIFDNDGWGANIYNKGAITLTNVRSNSNNGGWGMWLENTACGTATPCNVSLLTSGTGYNEFSSNQSGGGLRVNTYGVIVANKVSASSNKGYGMRLHNNTADALKPANITVTGGTFNTNDATGLYLLSRGVITVNGVEASNTQNDYQGAYLNNLADTTGNKGINVLKSKFNGNTWTGLYLRSYGAVVLNSLQAIQNMGAGADISNDYGKGKPVTVLAAYGANIFKQNIDDNIVIVSNGSVALTNVTGSESSTNDGIDIDNDSGTGTITLTNVTANSNYHNGFNLYTKGNVNIRGITAMFNYGLGGNYSGLYINTNNMAAAKVSITTGMITSNGDYGIQLDMFTPAIGPYLYTLSGVFYFGNNSDGVGGELNLWVH